MTSTRKAAPFPMRAHAMEGCFALDRDTIQSVLAGRSPGNYALGFKDGDAFFICYIGRSDTDLWKTLPDWVDVPSQYERYAPIREASWSVHHEGPLPASIPTLGRVDCGGSSYTHFAFSYAGSADAAFEKERRNDNDFGGRNALENEHAPHPAPI